MRFGRDQIKVGASMLKILDSVEEKIAGELAVSGTELAQNRVLRKNERRLSEVLASEEKQPFKERKEYPKRSERPEKKKVDIADLRKALEKSLAQDFGDEQVEKEARWLHDRELERAVTAVFGVLSSRIQGREAEQARMMLPSDLRELWPLPGL